MNRPLAVTIDISALPYSRGVSRYTSNLVSALVAQPEVALTLFGRSLRQYGVLKDWTRQFGSHVRTQLWPVPPQIFDLAWSYLRLPRLEMISPGIDVYHAWEWQLAPVSNTPQVVTIHDLAHLLYPETAHPKVVHQFSRLLTTLEMHPRWPVIAVSQATKKDIVNLTSISPDRVHVVYEALPEEAKVVPAKQEQAATLKRLGLQKPFLLAVGTTEPRKNLPRIIEAWRPLAQEFDLVIAGAAGWDTLPQHRGLHVLGYVEPMDLASLYRRAHCLVYASLYEGFGLPILEAYFHGCPVVTSRVSSMPEVAGKAALLVDPYDVAGMTEAIKKVAARDTIAGQQNERRMQAQLTAFSWQRAAQETIAVYRLAKEQA